MHGSWALLRSCRQVFGSVAMIVLYDLEGRLGEGGQAARPIWEYFFKKAFADKTLGLDRNAKFPEPENMKVEYDYRLINTQPVQNESNESGNGNADEYLSTPDAGNVPVESKKSMEEVKVLEEAKKAQSTETKKQGVEPEENNKKKGGFFKRLFKKKDKNN